MMTKHVILEQIFKLRKDINSLLFKEMLEEGWIDSKTYSTLRNPLCRRTVKKRILNKILENNILTKEMQRLLTQN